MYVEAAFHSCIQQLLRSEHGRFGVVVFVVGGGIVFVIPEEFALFHVTALLVRVWTGVQCAQQHPVAGVI